MCMYENKIKQQIKESNYETYIKIKDALNMEQKEMVLFALGLLGYNLQQNGMDVVIDKNKKYKKIKKI